jgi:fructokinase
MPPLVIGIGELLWDVLPDAKRLGGAPANFAFHASRLGADGRLVSKVGDDDLGREALDLLRQRGLDVSCVAVDRERPTGQVLARLSHGAAVYQFPQDSAWDRLEATPRVLDLARRADAVGFGTLAQRRPDSRAAIRGFLAETSPDCLRILDPNLRGEFYGAALLAESLELADVLKCSDEELDVFAGMFDLPPGAPDRLDALRRRFGLRLAAATRGGRGSLIASDDGFFDHPGAPAAIEDTIGAGDSFTAALAVGLLAGLDLHEVNDRANRTAAAVCARSGGMPEIPAELKIL